MHIGDADHFQNAKDVCVASLALDAVGDVEDHPGAFTVHHARHEIF